MATVGSYGGGVLMSEVPLYLGVEVDAEAARVLGMPDLRFRVEGLGVWVEGFKFRIKGLGVGM